MSLKDRLIEGVESLFDKLDEGHEECGVDREALKRELAKRVAVRERAGSPNPMDNPRARMAGAGCDARAKRVAHAAKRRATIHNQRSDRAASEKREQEAAFRKMREAANHMPPPPPPPPRPSTGRASSPPGSKRRASGRRRPTPFRRGDTALSAEYNTLGVSPDVSDAELKSAYRKLMRKYHPDLHPEPRKKKAATLLATKISTAYAAIEKSRK